ncbi:MAG: hypothetical protein K8R92_08965 [Planctomycetes bacterium]|nr:hypothetical protein [Planctomycetota bacterium]
MSISATLAAMALASQASANLLTDPSFETNAVDTFTNTLGNFPLYQGVWGQESSTITGFDSGSSPLNGFNQLRMAKNGGGTTQAGQVIDVSSYGALIDSGNAQLVAYAYFNSNAPAAVGGVYISYFTGNSYGTIFGPLDATAPTFDGNVGTWQGALVNVIIPANTRWILMQVAFSEASLPDINRVESVGFVDDAFLEIYAVPAPSAAALLGLVGLAARRRRI